MSSSRCWMLVSGCWIAASVTALAQGPLAPSGAPAPTMKSLSQVEPRTAITNLPYAITNSGSYYLTGNLAGAPGQHGIEVHATDATIDLNGFSLNGGVGTLSGIYQGPGAARTTVRNGTVSYWFGDNIRLVNGSQNVVEDVLATGAGGSGIYVSQGTVARCQSSQNATAGIVCAYGKVTDCLADNNTYGIQASIAVVEGCYVSYNNTGILGYDATIESCKANNNYIGFRLDAGGTVKNSDATDNGYGIYATDSAMVDDCLIRGSTNWGIYAAAGLSVNRCRVEGGATTGITAGTASMIVDTVASSNRGDGIVVGDASRIEHCIASDNGNNGFTVGDSSLIQDCVARRNGGRGIKSSTYSILRDNIANHNGWDGIYAGGIGVVERNMANYNGTNTTLNGSGIRFTGNAGRVVDNHAIGNYYAGLSVLFPPTVVARNYSSNNATNFDIPSGGVSGPVTNSAAAGGAWSNLQP